MRCYDQGDLYKVTVSEAEVADFARKWPCFGRVTPLSFQFEKSTGDLVDVRGTHGMDESGVLALMYDAQHYGLERLSRVGLG